MHCGRYISVPNNPGDGHFAQLADMEKVSPDCRWPRGEGFTWLPFDPSIVKQSSCTGNTVRTFRRHLSGVRHRLDIQRKRRIPKRGCGMHRCFLVGIHDRSWARGLSAPNHRILLCHEQRLCKALDEMRVWNRRHYARRCANQITPARRMLEIDVEHQPRWELSCV